MKQGIKIINEKIREIRKVVLAFDKENRDTSIQLAQIEAYEDCICIMSEQIN